MMLHEVTVEGIHFRLDEVLYVDNRTSRPSPRVSMAIRSLQPGVICADLGEAVHHSN